MWEQQPQEYFSDPPPVLSILQSYLARGMRSTGAKAAGVGFRPNLLIRTDPFVSLLIRLEQLGSGSSIPGGQHLQLGLSNIIYLFYQCNRAIACGELVVRVVATAAVGRKVLRRDFAAAIGAHRRRSDAYRNRTAARFAPTSRCAGLCGENVSKMTSKLTMDQL